ncbi:GPI inositol-deacylase [Stomoxys calcitrans]|uniref:GPI inositol-deacylase n=1 Tax=Stomoxys calcitrans TaxID=35570 RepID=UPI0027E30FCC|nr:GPI inositol-deacylase [Stomoxys calcitrans]
MFKNAFILIIVASFGCFLYGIRHIYLEVEDNACRMTYMFGVPQFSQVEFEDNKLYPHYGLYYYYEGKILQNVNNLKLTGAPVIFIPGNAGSYKQVRSLASVALRKGMDNERGIHLDYFTVNFEEQLSALYGGYLENQKKFLHYAILAVRRLYAKKYNVDKSVILIGHSMGGKVAESALQDPEISKYINTVLYISTPIDKPVVYFDSKLDKFYATSTNYLYNKHASHIPNRETNVCTNFQDKIPHRTNESMILDNVLMISMGGGNRDLLVRDGLTISQFSDIHAMTSSIPNVWLSCDHLSIVWCLQLVTVINRFLFGITVIDDYRNVYFSNDKLYRTRAAINYFVKPLNKRKPSEIEFTKSTGDSIWQEDSKIAFRKSFKYGLRTEYNHMMPVSKYKDFKKVYIEIDSFEDFEDDWIYGCAAVANAVNGGITCEQGLPISHYVQNIPSNDRYRSIALLDFQHLINYYPDWSHVLVRLKTTSKATSLKIDAYRKDERRYQVKSPRLFSFKPKVLVNETTLGTIHNEILIEGLEEPFPTLQFKVEPLACANDDYEVNAKICVPWARGYDRHVHRKHDSKDKHIYVNAPFSAPSGYNTTENPITLELYLNPACRYRISYELSVAGTSSKIVQEFYHWLPAHLTAVLFWVLRNQIVKFQNSEKTIFIKPYAGFFQCKSLYIVTACRLLKKMLMPMKFLPITTDATNYSFYVSIIIHGTAIVLSIIAVFAIWTVLTFHGNILYKIALKMTRISSASSEVLLKIMSTLPLSFGALFISISMATCSGIGLLLATIFYFLMISNAYKDYLEDWAKDKAKGIFKTISKKFKERNKKKSDETALVPSNAEVSTNNEDNEEDNQEENDNENEVQNAESVEYFEGLENFAFHIAMLLLLGIMAMLNFGLGIAWIKSHYHGHHLNEHLPDPSLWPSIITLSSLSLLLQAGAPHKSSGYNYVAIVLYMCFCCCILYCQEHIYRLNYLIAAVYLSVALQEVLHYIQRRRSH